MDYLHFHPAVISAAILEKKIAREEKAENVFRLLYVDSGEVTLGFAGQKSEKLSSGGLCFLPKGTAFSVRAGMCRAVTVTFDGFDAEPPFDRPAVFPDFEETEKIFGIAEVFASGTKTAPAYASALLTELLLSLAEEKDEDALPTRLVKKLDGYIEENHDATLSNTELAAVFGYHPFYLSQMLKAKTGLTLRQYVAAYRFRLAKSLLVNTDLPVAEIAERTGFADASYFTKSFRKEVGQTPKEYRKNGRDGEL